MAFALSSYSYGRYVLGTGIDPELEFGGLCLFHVKSLLALLFAMGNIAVLGATAIRPTLDPPLSGYQNKDPIYFISFIDSNNMIFAPKNCILLSPCVL